MPEQVILLQWRDSEVSVTAGATIHREELYGRQIKTVVERDGAVLEKVVLDPEGNIFLTPDITYLQTDGQGSLTTPARVQTEDGELLPQQPSSFKAKRTLQPADLADLVRLRVDAVLPVACDLAHGLYSTEFTYRDSHVLKAAVLNVTPERAFLLTGSYIETPMQGKTDVYSFFDEDEEPADDGDDGEISFVMF